MSGHWTDKELIDAPVELLDDKDIERQRKLQAKRAKKMASNDLKQQKAKEKTSNRILRAFQSKKSKDPFGELDITGAQNDF